MTLNQFDKEYLTSLLKQLNQAFNKLQDYQESDNLFEAGENISKAIKYISIELGEQ